MPHLDTVLLCQLSKEVGEAAAKDAGWGETGLGVEPPPTEKSEKVDEEDRLDWPGRSSGRHPALAAPLAARAEAPVGLSSTCSQGAPSTGQSQVRPIAGAVATIMVGEVHASRVEGSQ